MDLCDSHLTDIYAIEVKLLMQCRVTIESMCSHALCPNTQSLALLRHTTLTLNRPAGRNCSWEEKNLQLFPFVSGQMFFVNSLNWR